MCVKMFLVHFMVFIGFLVQPVCAHPPHVLNDPSTTAEAYEDEAGLSLNSESDDESGMMHCTINGDTLLSSICTSNDEASISFESDLETNPCQYKVEQNSSLDEAGLSLESSTDHDQVSFSDNSGDDFETVQAVLPKQKPISNFVLSEVSTGKTMKMKATSLLSIKSAKKEKCSCPNECMKKISITEIRAIRHTFWSNSKTFRMQLLKHYISNSVKHGHYRFLSVGRLSLCSKAFCIIHRVNKNTFSRGLHMDRRNTATLPGKKPRNLSQSTLLLLNWLEDYGTYHGDRMPNTKEVLLPYKTVKTDLFAKYKIDLTKWNQHPVSRPQFFKVWDTYFPHLKIKKTNSFSKCTTCTTLEKQLEKTTCVQTRAKYKQMKDDHNLRQMMERKYYYGKREKSRNNPAAFMSLIIDGMDQAKTNLPHFTGRLPKNIKGSDLLKTHVTGVISHGHGGFHTFIDVNEYPHDPNLTLNVLLKMLKKTAEENENKLPPTLFIQADNCSRENKNRYVLAFCELLVRERIFTEVHLSFLYVGHTHEDVDAGFSQIAEKLRKTDVETLNDLISVLPQSSVLNDLFNIKSWLEPYINAMSGVSGPLHYKFQLVNEAVANFYKGQHSSVWISMDNILSSLPKGEPNVLFPDCSKIDCVKNLKQTEIVKELFKKRDSFKTWQEFYELIDSGRRVTTSVPEWIFKTLPRQIIHAEEIFDLPEEIKKLAERDIQVPKLVIRKRQQTRQKSARPSRGSQEKGKGKKKQNAKAGKSSVKGSTRKIVVKRTTLILVTVFDDIKRHIWLIIFLDLLQQYILLYMLIFIIFLHLRIFCLTTLLNMIKTLASSIIIEHVGALSSNVAKLHNITEGMTCITGLLVCC